MTMPVAPVSPGVAAAATAQAPVAPVAPSKPTPYEKRTARAEALRASLDAEPDPNGADEATSTSEPEEDAADPAPPGQQVSTTASSPDAAAATAVPDALAKAREERLARIAQVRARENADEAERTQRQQGKAREGEIEQLRKRIAELEPQITKFKSPSELLAYAEREGMTAEDVIKELRTRLTDPAAIAARQTQTAEQKWEAKLAEERAAREALEKKIEDQQREAREVAESQHKARTFIERSGASAETHPLSAALLEKHGPEGYIKFANHFIAQYLPVGYSVEQLHDYVEQFLDETQVGGASRPVALPANGPTGHPSPKNGAGKPATTLSNALTAERATVTEETPLHRLPRAERTRRLREQLERE